MTATAALACAAVFRSATNAGVSVLVTLQMRDPGSYRSTVAITKSRLAPIASFILTCQRPVVVTIRLLSVPSPIVIPAPGVDVPETRTLAAEV